MALDISELDMDSATMSARYEQQMREQQGQLQKEDLSDMVAEHAAKQKVYSLPPPPSLPPPLSLSLCQCVCGVLSAEEEEGHC